MISIIFFHQQKIYIDFVCTSIPNCRMSAPVNLFLDLIELEDLTAKGIFSSLLQHLQPF
jgi:hypothetical protein